MGFEVAGWVGSALVLIAYALLSTHRLAGSSRLYQELNLLGAAGLLANGLFHRAYPSVSVNVIWAVISIYALLRLLTERRRSVAPAE
jgi:hypothetical protein